MAKLLTDEAKAFRRIVEELDGHQASIAELLGVTRQSVSARLRANLHNAWWRAFKRTRAVRRKRESQARYRRRAGERMREAWFGRQ